MICPDGCGLDKPDLSGFEPEKLLYTVSDGVSTITCDGTAHYLNATRGRWREIGKCDCEKGAL